VSTSHDERHAQRERRTLRVEVVRVDGRCPVWVVGDGYKLCVDRPVCMHALQSISPYCVALSQGIPSRELGLAGSDGAACVQCLDPCRYTGGGTVTMRIGVEDEPDRAVVQSA